MLCSKSVLQDEFGPERILDVYDARTGMEGVLVVDNTALGPGKGGIRLVPDVTVLEVARLARAMTWKNALAGLPFGGAKAGIRADPKKIDRTKFVTAFADKVRPFVPQYYIAGPDMNTTEAEMAAFATELRDMGACTGKPEQMGGLPHELGSTGFGVACSTKVALDFAGIGVAGSTVAIEGFGNVGMFTARFLSAAGAKIVAVSDSSGTACLQTGFDVALLEKAKREKGKVTAYPGAKPIPSDGIFGVAVDVLIPGARPDAISGSNKAGVKARIIVEAANIPVSVEIEEEFRERGILVVPDVVANAGGVISSYVETTGGTRAQMFSLVEKTVSANTRTALEKSAELKVSPREAALRIAKERVSTAMQGRRPAR